MKNVKTVWETSFNRIREEYRRSFLVSFGLFLILLLAGFLLISGFLKVRIQSQEAEAGLLKTRLEYRYSLVRHKDDLDKGLTSLENNWRFIQAKVFAETSDDSTLSHIQQMLDKLATAGNIAIRSYKFEGTRRVGNFSVLPVSLEFSAGYEAITSFLNLIENQQYYLKISDLEIRSFEGNENVIVRMVVEGYRYHEKAIS